MTAKFWLFLAWLIIGPGHFRALGFRTADPALSTGLRAWTLARSSPSPDDIPRQNKLIFKIKLIPDLLFENLLGLNMGIEDLIPVLIILNLHL